MDLTKKIGAVVFALALFVVLATIVKTTAKAASNDVDLNVVTTVSPDNGQTRTTDACVPSGTTVQIRTVVWNDGTDDVYRVNGTAEATNSSYLRDCTTNSNEDGDNYGYTGDTVNGQFQTNYLAANSSEVSGYQSAVTTCRVEAPCDTTIRGTVTLVDYNTDHGTAEQYVGNFLGRALATTGVVNDVSAYTVRVAGGTCPKTCGGSTSKTTSLPQTGNSIIDLVNSLF